MFLRVTAFVLLVAVTRVAAQPDAQAAAPAPDPSSPVLVADKEPPTVTASVEDEPFEEGDYDAFAPGPGPAPNDTLNCSTIEGITGNMPGVDLFYELAKFSGLEQMVVPGGVFHDVVGDISVFAPSDDALLEEIAYFGEVFNLTPEEVKEDKPVLQEILRQFIAYGDVTKVKGFRGLFVTLDGSVWNWTDSEVGDGKSEIALVPVGLQLEEPVVFFKVDDAAGVRTGCSRGMRLSAVTRDNVRFRSAERRAWRRYKKDEP